MFLSSFSIVLIIACGIWHWRKCEKRVAILEGVISDQCERHKKEMDDFEYSVKESIRITANRVQDGRCKDVADELRYMVENFDVHKMLTR